MDVIKIGKDNMIVILTKEDMTKYRISPDMPAGFGRQALSALRQIAFGAQEESAPSHGDEKLLVQVFPSKEGGCEMFVTRVSSVSCTDLQNHYIHTDSKEIYMFAEMAELLAACRSLAGAGYSAESRAWAETDTENRRYFLELCDEYGHMCEFGARRLAEIAPYYINEHCSLICADAVTVLGALA